jgi:N-acetylglucosamine-6-phosphate deacetylase
MKKKKTFNLAFIIKRNHLRQISIILIVKINKNNNIFLFTARI